MRAVTRTPAPSPPPTSIPESFPPDRPALDGRFLRARGPSCRSARPLEQDAGFSRTLIWGKKGKTERVGSLEEHSDPILAGPLRQASQKELVVP